MKVFLVVVALWSMAYRSEQATPLLVQPMPSMEACQAVGRAILEMTRDGTHGGSRFRCVQSS
jgi:hypothetical protein